MNIELIYEVMIGVKTSFQNMMMGELLQSLFQLRIMMEDTTYISPELIN